ncbi:hypothetical protein C8J57DRAFT_1231847 [Mycena rebaudengoi]|nr:hypothetical protein C8J57DRAFT_1231847 [Mycena rebaudengoi]
MTREFLLELVSTTFGSLLERPGVAPIKYTLGLWPDMLRKRVPAPANVTADPPRPQRRKPRQSAARAPMGTGSQPNLYRLQAQTTTHALDVTPPTSTRCTHSPLRSTPRRHATTRLDGEPARKPEHKEVVTPRQQASSTARSTRHASARRAYETAQDTDTDTARRHVDDTARRIKIRALASSTPTRAAQPDHDLRRLLPPPTACRTPPRPPPRRSCPPEAPCSVGFDNTGLESTGTRPQDYPARTYTAHLPSPRTPAPARTVMPALDSRRKTRRAGDSVYLQAHTLAPYAHSQDTHTPRTPSAGSTARMHKPPTGTHPRVWMGKPAHAAIPAGCMRKRRAQSRREQKTRCRRPTREEEDTCVGDGALVVSMSPHVSLSLHPQYWSAAEERGARGADGQQKTRGDGALVICEPARITKPASPLPERSRRAGSKTKARQDIGAPRRKVGRRAGGPTANALRVKRGGGRKRGTRATGYRSSEDYKPVTAGTDGGRKKTRGVPADPSKAPAPAAEEERVRGVAPPQVRPDGDGAYAAPSRNPRCWRAWNGAHSEWSVRGRRRATNFLRAEDEERVWLASKRIGGRGCEMVPPSRGRRRPRIRNENDAPFLLEGSTQEGS